MQGYRKRILTADIFRRLKYMPAVALLGPRQCGKSTLAKHIIKQMDNAIYLDLERTSERNKLRDPEAFFSLNKGGLICLDEIQRVPELFPSLRSVLDEEERNGQLFMLGSASRDLIQQSSETLAGRISYLELTPFQLDEVGQESLWELWLKGGFPRSFLEAVEVSYEWRQDFIRTFLERDIPQLGFRIPARSMERLWRMCAHGHGQTLNASKIGASLGVSHHTVRSYIDILAETFLMRILPPYESNLKKRLVKSPKIYIRDTGLLHALLDIRTQNDLLGHPVYGASWEGFVLESIISRTPDWRHSFYRTATGVELDLILEKGLRTIAIECKVATAPKPTKGFWQAIKDLSITEAYMVAPIDDAYPIERGVMVASVAEFLKMIGSR
jgi:predicted AAA+ superfamily ATPase